VQFGGLKAPWRYVRCMHGLLALNQLRMYYVKRLLKHAPVLYLERMIPLALRNLKRPSRAPLSRGATKAAIEGVDEITESITNTASHSEGRRGVRNTVAATTTQKQQQSGASTLGTNQTDTILINTFCSFQHPIE